MPLIRYTYEPDIRRFGDKPVVVEDIEAKTLVGMLRAVLVSPEDLEELLTKPELAEVAEQVGADVKARDSKGHFVKAITEAS